MGAYNILAGWYTGVSESSIFSDDAVLNVDYKSCTERSMLCMLVLKSRNLLPKTNGSYSRKK